MHPDVLERIPVCAAVATRRGLSSARCVAARCSPPRAAARPPCWKKLLNDWYDGSIDKIYPLPCYRQAINHLPTDVAVYSSAKDDILRALARESAEEAGRRRRRRRPRRRRDRAAPTTTEDDDEEAATTPTTTTAPTTTEQEVVPTTATTTSPAARRRRRREGDRRPNPGDADSFPLPLLILGGLAILLLAAGVVGMIWRRMDRGDTDAGRRTCVAAPPSRHAGRST